MALPRWNNDLLRKLSNQGICPKPSDAQQMILEMVPDAMWEVLSVVTTYHPEFLTAAVTITTQVSCVRLTEGPRSVEMEIDVLNKETITETLRDDHTRTPTHPITRYTCA